MSSLEESRQILQSNYDDLLSLTEQKADARPMPPVLWSVVKFRSDEQESLRLHLVGPMLAYSMTSGPALSAVLIERKNASSKDVLVREFFNDGTEDSYFWPTKHASKDGFWSAEIK